MPNGIACLGLLILDRTEKVTGGHFGALSYLAAGTASQAEAGTALLAADIVLLGADTDLLEAGMAVEEAYRELALDLACSSAAVVHSWHLSAVLLVACTA